MKILYIALERSDAQAAASVLRSTAPDVVISWASRLEDGAHWIFSNRDLVALILDARLGTEPCGSFVKQLRKRGLTAPAIVVTVGGLSASSESLGLGADDIVVRQQMLATELPAAVRRALNRQRPTVARDDLAQKLSDAQAALERTERTRTTDAAAAADQLAQRSHAFTLSLSEVIHSRDALEQRLDETARTLEQVRQDLETSIAAANEHRVDLETRIEQAVSGRAAAERSGAVARQKLADIEAELETARERHAAESATSASEQIERQARHDAELAQVAGARTALEQKLVDLGAALLRAEAARAREATAATDLSRDRDNLQLRLDEVTTTRAAAEQQVADARQELDTVRTALDKAKERHAADSAAADRLQAEHQARHDAEVAQLASARGALAQRGTDLEAALRRTEEMRTSDAAASADLSARLAEAATVRNALELKLSDLTRSAAEADARSAQALVVATERQRELEGQIAHERDTRVSAEDRLVRSESVLADANARHASEVAAAARVLVQRETELTGALAEAGSIRGALERKLADVGRAAADADARAQHERLAAIERHTNLEGELAHERDARLAVEGRLSRADAAATDAIARHTAEMSAAAERLTQRERELGTRIAEVSAAHETAFQRLTQTEASLQAAQEQALREGLEAVEEAARRQTAFDDLLRQEVDQRRAVEEILSRIQRERQQADETATRDRLVAAEQFTAAMAAATRNRLADAEQHAAAIAAAAADLQDHRSRFGTELAQAHAIVQALEGQLAEAERTRREADETATRDRLAVAEQHAATMAGVTRDRLAAAEQHAGALAAAARDRQTDAEQHAAALAAAAADLQNHRSRFATELAQAQVIARGFEGQLAESERARREADETATRDRLAAADRHAAAMAAATRDRQADAEQHAAAVAAAAADLQNHRSRFATELAQAQVIARGFEGQLAEAERARREADEAATRERLAAADQHAAAMAAATRDREAAAEQHATALVAAALDLQNHRSQFDTALAQAHSITHALETELAEAERARREADEAATRERLAVVEQHATAMAAATRDRQTDAEQHAAELATATRDRLAAAEQHAAELAALSRARQADTEQAAQQQWDLEAQLDRLREERRTLEERLATSEIARRDAEVQHASDMAAVVTRFGERQARLEGELTQTTAARDALSQQAGDLEAALARVQRNLEASILAVNQLTEREVELSALLSEATATCDMLEAQRVTAASSLQAAEDRASRERLLAMEHQAELSTRIANESDRRKSLEREIEATRSAADAAQQLFLDEIAAMTTRAEQHLAELGEQMARDRADHLIAMQVAEEHTEELELERDALLESLRMGAEQAELMTSRHRDERESLERERLTVEADMQRLAGEHVDAVMRLDAQVGKRDAQLKEWEARHAAFQQAADESVARLESRLRTAAGELEQLQGQLSATTRELESTRGHRDHLQKRADEVPQLQRQLDEMRVQMHWQFEQHPLALCRSTRDGVLTHANRAFAAMVGCPSADPRQTLDVASRLFASSNDLPALVQRSLTPGATATIESTWGGVGGGRLVVRSSALATPDAIHIVLEDVTPHRALQEKLGHAQRMEAVGRLASEVAVTCGNLLNDVSRDGQRWVSALDGPTSRQHGERLLSEVTRAASFLRQFAEYGDEQAAPVEAVDLQHILRELEPVLQEVAGDEIELVLPDRSAPEPTPFNVDVTAERVERLLVNVASYSRERMPSGGTMVFDLAPALVDRQFIEKHPNVRQGPHVVLTVTEARGAVRSMGPLGFNDDLSEANDALPGRPGVDLGALQGLVRECGGHLWMEAAPPGDMRIKIHLPLRDF